MKNHIHPILVLVLVLFACDEPLEIEYASDAEKIADIWIWVKAVGGISGEEFTPESTGQESRIVFSRDGYLSWYDNPYFPYRVKYSLGRDITIFSTDSVPVVIVDSSAVFKYAFLGNDTLILDDNYYDGFQRTYARN